MAVAAGVLCLLLSGCASPGPYRTDKDSNHKIIESYDSDGYEVGYVEFDEQGWFWMPDNGDGDIGHREQLFKVQNMVANSSQLDKAPQHEAKAIILVAFVHGWRNNAEPGVPNNVPQFKGLLARMAGEERKRHPDAPRKVVGVYIGWPGLSANREPFETLSFFSRKNAGDRVGNYGGVTEVLSRLESLSDSINEGLPKRDRSSMFVVVGHSFGAQVVYDSLMQIMTQRVAERRTTRLLESRRAAPVAIASEEQFHGRELPPGGYPLQPFGDLVVLVNPAFEGERYYNLKTLSEQFRYPDRQRPVLAIFCSETDWAAGKVFPIGRFFSTFWERYRPAPLADMQHRTNLRTIPWTDDFVTHRLLTTDEYKKEIGPPPPPVPWNETTRKGPLTVGGCVLLPNPANQSPWTPFYVVKVDKELIDGHNDIWREGFNQFVEGFISSTEWQAAGDASHRILRGSVN